MSASARTARHWQGLDGLRALAVIAVIVYHFSPGTLPGGFLGVDVFFVISGYLITRLLTEEFIAAGRVDVKRFYLRRARRLLPALFLVLAIVTVAALVWRDQLATVRGGVLATAVFGGNWWLAFDHQSYFVAAGRPSMLQHLWSLGVEEQFYLFWPLITAATLAAGRRSIASGTGSVRRMVTRLSLLAVALSVASTTLTWILADARDVPYGNDGSTLYFGTDTHSMGLLLGAALGAWAAVQTPILVRSAAVERCVEAAGATALLVLVLFTVRLADYSHSLYRGDFLVVSTLVVVVIAVATRPTSVLGRLLDLPALRWVGVRSYSLYLWHWPITVVTRPGIDTTMPTWLDQVLRLTLTVVLSDLTFRFVETPVRRQGWRPVRLAAARRIRRGWRRSPLRPSVATPLALVGVGIIAIGVIVIGPGAPTPDAAVGATAGGQHLRLSHPGPIQHVHDPNRLPHISAFGDSVLLGARKAIGDVFPGGSIDAVESRQPDPILDDVRRDARAGTLRPLVVMHIGNNGLINPDLLQHTLQTLASRKLVIVLNDHTDPYDRDWQKPNNATLSRIVPEFGNTALVNWDKLAGEHRGWLYNDDLHLRPAGTAAYADLLATTYRNATRPRSPLTPQSSPPPSPTATPTTTA